MVVNTPTGVGRALNSDRVVAFGKKGMADILGVHNGLALAVECKVGKDKLSPEQIKFRKAWTRCGGVFIEARSVKQCLDELDSIINLSAIPDTRDIPEW